MIYPSLSFFLLPKQPRGKIHTKMPVILLLEDGDEWLNPDMRAGTMIAFVKTICG
jgi:putative SOS response-associated peptidase YedK